MGKQTKTSFLGKKKTRAALIILSVVTLAFIIVHVVVKKKIVAFINESDWSNTLTYSKYDFSLMSGSFEMDSLTYSYNGNNIFVKRLELNHLRYFGLIFQDKINIGEILLKNPKVKLLKAKELFPKNDESSKKEFDKIINIGELKVQNGQFSYYSDTLLQAHINTIDIDLNQINVSSESLKNKLPFNYASYSIKGDGLFYHVEQLHNIETKDFSIETNKATFNGFHLIPNYSREDYVKVIPYQRDLLEVNLKEIKIDDYKLTSDSNFIQFTSKKIELNDSKMSVYRDKNPAPDTTLKDPYSKILRELPFKIQVDSLFVNQMELLYMQQNISETSDSAKINFNKMNAIVTDLTNVDMERENFPSTKINIKCLFMGNAPLDVHWSFKVNSPKDVFTIKGSGTNVPPAAANRFLKPAKNMELIGKPIKKLYFNFKGDDEFANGEFRMVYDHLEVKLYKDNSQQEKKVFGFVANLFVQHQDDMETNKVKLDRVDRDKTKAFWNYFWRCISAGLKKSLIKAN